MVHDRDGLMPRAALHDACGAGAQHAGHVRQHAAERGANAIINMRYDANEVMNGITEVLAYGTAVTVEKAV